MTQSAIDILEAEGAVARRLAGFEPRTEQLQMAAAVEGAMERKGVLLAEAGTGVGKSFAYLVPAILRVAEKAERVVVATHTIALQEQLIEKDIPLLRAALPHEFSAVLVKGRGNYLSLRRLKMASERAGLLFPDPDQQQTLQAIEDWAYETADGTVATLPQMTRPDVWDRVQSDADNCMGRRCPTYDKCFYQQARRRMERANILICNHAIFFADLAMRSGDADARGFLPDYQHVILDEAHNVEDVACEHFGRSLPEARVRHLLSVLHVMRGGRRGGKARGFLATYFPRPEQEEACAKSIQAVELAREACDEFFVGMMEWGEGRSQRASEVGGHEGFTVRIRKRGAFENALTPAMEELARRLEDLKESAAREEDAFELNAYAKRAREIAVGADALVEQRSGEHVFWMDVQRRRGSGGGSLRGQRHVTLASAPVDVSGILRERLFSRGVSVTLTSATLTTGQKNFTHIATRLGCPDHTQQLTLGSPFDYEKQVQFFAEAGLPEPGESGYVERLAERVLHHVLATNGGAFVLFTSYTTLRECASRLKEMLNPKSGRVLPLIVHGQDGPRGLLLRRFRETPNSVLLGVASFWQGVDVRGEALRNVIITRLPFDAPDQPLTEARGELIKAGGGNAFRDDALPRAVIRFKQGFGRLIRSRTDTGRVVVLDSRIQNKPYGKVFLKALPAGLRLAEAE